MPSPGSQTRLKIDFAQASDPGRDPNKQVNEDSCGYAETAFGHLVVLCDGMGGHYGGKEASRTAIATIFQMMEQTPTSVPASAALKAAIEEAGRRVYRLGGGPENRARPGSTVVAMVLHDRGVDVAHVGDSRAYVIRSGQIYPLTRDHSMVQGMIDAGMLTEEQAIGHPDSNKITRALGMKPEVEVEVRPEPMELFPGDLLLTSSDGLTDLALAPDILGATKQALASGSVAHACSQLIAMANERGGHDNITVQIARVTETAPKPVTTIPQGPAGGGTPNAHAAAPMPAPQAMAHPPVAPSGPLETVPMTSPGGGPAPQGLAYPPASTRNPPMAAAPQAPPWAPVPPTATDRPGMAGGVGPTAPGVTPQGYHPAGATGAPRGPQTLAPYQADTGPSSLPLPPTSPYVAGAQPPNGYGPQYTPAPASLSQAGAQPSRGGVLFVILGLSAAIAILIVALIWALFLR
jgi:protein phosphatase